MMRANTTESLQQLADRVTDRFESRFGRSPRWIAAAPGRVNIIGEHIDYSDGFVLPMAIERYCVIAGSIHEPGSSSATATIISTTSGDEAKLDLSALQPHSQRGHWSNYVAGVLAEFIKRSVKLPSIDLAIDTNVPLGGGLSSSASLEVATATLLEVITGNQLTPSEKALLCQKAEHEYPGVPCGIMDQFASAMGRPDHLMLLDCRSQQVEHIPLLDPSVTVLIINTNVKHELSGSEYAERRSQCESAAKKLGVRSLRDVSQPQLKVRGKSLSDIELRRARHAVSEIARTVKAAEAVKAGDWTELGQLMYASHDSLRDDYEVSCHELDVLVDLARSIGRDGGVIGSRMTGGGFGGCTVTMVETSRIDDVTSQLLEQYKAATGIEGTALISRPARGTHILCEAD